MAAGDARRDHYFKRCFRYLPLVQARTPSVRRFEALLRAGVTA